MAERAIFLDRDNTIIENDGYLGDPAKVKLLPGAATALSAIRALGYRLIVVSNQSGVARGLFDEAAVESVNDEVSRQLKQQAGAYIDASYYCPYHPEAVIPEYRIDHEWRKPKPGMLTQAAADFGLDLAQSWMIGDQARDIAAGAAAGTRTILLRDADRRAVSDPATNVSPNFVVRTLADAARILAREGRNLPPPSPTPHPPEPVAPAVLQTRPTPAPPLTKTPSTTIESPLIPHPTHQPTPEPKIPHPTSTPAPIPSTPTIPAHPSLEKNLDELISQLRQQNRNAELHPEFSLANIAALIMQAFAVVALVIGLANHFTAKVTFSAGIPDMLQAQLTHQQSLFWATTAAVLQGITLALLLHARNK